MSDTKRVLVITAGDKARGMGLVMRSLTLADELKSRGVGVDFCCQLDTPGAVRITQAGYPIYADWIGLAGADDAVIVDLKPSGIYEPHIEFLQEVRPHARKLIAFTGAGWAKKDIPVGLLDLQIAQSVLVDAPAAPGVLVGPEWLMVKSEYTKCIPDKDGPIVVVMGGSDPHGLTGVAAVALHRIDRQVKIVVGPACRDNYHSGSVDNLEYIIAPSSLVDMFNGASLYLGAFGMTTYEALCAGLPVINTGWSTDHMRTVDALAHMGVARSLGRWDMVTVDRIRLAVETFEWKTWEAQSRKARALVDGKGVGRVADKILEMLA